jgi:hypothetical protein
VFSNKGRKMKIDLQDRVVRFVVQDYVNQICNYQSDEELDFDVHKLIHTFMVVEMAQALVKLAKPKLTPKIQKQILNAAVLHDLGRCHEFEKGVHLKKIDHGKIGARLIEKHFPNMKAEIQSTLYHNKCASDKDPKSCQPVLDYVRDADMLANIKYEIEHFDTFLTHIFHQKTSAFLTPIIDDEIIQAVLQKRPARWAKLKADSLLNGFLFQMCWFFNLRTSAANLFIHKTKLFVNYKHMIYQRLIPMITSNKKIQNKLMNQIDEIFPDAILSK